MTRNQYQYFGTFLGIILGLVFVLVSRNYLPDIYQPHYWASRVWLAIALIGCHLFILLRIMDKYGVKD